MAMVCGRPSSGCAATAQASGSRALQLWTLLLVPQHPPQHSPSPSPETAAETAPVIADLVPLASCRIAKQASALYTDVLLALQQPPLASHLDKSWTAHAIAKAGMYEAQAILESGNAFRTEDHIASEIARLRVRPCSHIPCNCARRFARGD